MKFLSAEKGEVDHRPWKPYVPIVIHCLGNIRNGNRIKAFIAPLFILTGEVILGILSFGYYRLNAKREFSEKNSL